MSIKLVSKKLTEELRKSGANAASKNRKAYKNFVNPRVTDKGKFYRFRLLWFADEASKRTKPSVETFNHTIYNRDDDNKLSIDYVTCLSSDHLKIENGWKKCPICQFVDKQYKLAQDSNWTNKTALGLKNKLQRKFVAFVPIYVISDPVNPENTGRVMILNLRDREAYTALEVLIKATEYNHQVFNDEHAVDLAMAVNKVPQKDKNGELRINSSTGEPWTNTIYKFKFTDKPYDLTISGDQIEALDFDESIYTYSSPEELQDFLSRNTIGVEIPDEDISFDVDNEVKSDIKKEETPDDDLVFDIAGEDVTDEVISDDDIDGFDLAEEVSDKKKDDLVSGDINLDDILGDIPDLDDLDDIAY